MVGLAAAGLAGTVETNLDLSLQSCSRIALRLWVRDLCDFEDDLVLKSRHLIGFRRGREVGEGDTKTQVGREQEGNEC